MKLCHIFLLLACIVILQPSFAGTVYVGTGSSISVIQPESNSVVRTMPVPLGPTETLAVSPDGAFIYVSNLSSVYVIQAATGSVLATINVAYATGSITVTPDGKSLWVSNSQSSSVSIIDLGTNTITATIPVEIRPWGIAFTPNGSRAYVANTSSASVSVIDVATKAVITTVPTGVEPTGVAVTPDGNFVYVTNINGFAPSGSVSVISAATNTVVATISVGSRPLGVAFTPNGALAYIANGFTNDVSVIDTTTRSVVATIPIVADGSDDRWLTITPDGTRVYVANRFSGTVSVIDTTSRSVIATIPVGNGPAGIAATPATRPSLLVASANANSIFRYDQTTGAFLQKFDNTSVQYPYNVVLGLDGFIYTATTTGSGGNVDSHIDRFDPATGKLLASFGALPLIRGMTIGADGLIYASVLSSNGTGQVWRFNPNTKAFDVFIGSVSSPNGLAFGPDGNLYVCAAGTDSVQKFNGTTGALISTILTEPGLSPIFNLFGPDGKMYLGTQLYPDQVRRYTINGVFDTVFATSTNLKLVTAMAFGPDGNLYVASDLDASILRFHGTTGAFIDTFVTSGSGGLGTNPTGILFQGAATPTTGTINVTTNLSSATFTITGPANYSGSGTSFTINNAPAGTYTIKYNPVTCFSTPAPETEILSPRAVLTFSSGNYHGIVSVSIDVGPKAIASDATFIIRPPIPGLTGVGPYPATQNDVWPQTYTVTFGDVKNFNTPPPQTLSPSGLCSLAFYGGYSAKAIANTAELTVSVNLDKGGYTISSTTDPNGFKQISAQGTSALSPVITRVPPGTYQIVFTPVIRYYIPATQLITLNSGDAASIRGLYERLLLVTFTGFGNAPHNSPTIANCVVGGNVGSGFEYTQPQDGAGMTQLIPEIQGSPGVPALKPGLTGAAFTFYSTNNNHQQDGDACTPPVLPQPDHAEAEEWLRKQHPQSSDKLVIAGHSYGGNRARLFVEQLKRKLNLNVDLLVTVDPIEWTKCNLAAVLFSGDLYGNAARLCNQSSFVAGTIPPSEARTIYSLFQTDGLGSSTYQFPLLSGYIMPGSSSELVPDNHTGIDDNSSVHQTIRRLMLDLVRRPTINAAPGLVTATTSRINVPITLSNTGTTSAANVSISTATLNSIDALNTTQIGSLNLGGGIAKDVTLVFPRSAAGSITSGALSIRGTYDSGQSFGLNVNVFIP